MESKREIAVNLFKTSCFECVNEITVCDSNKLVDLSSAPAFKKALIGAWVSLVSKN